MPWYIYSLIDPRDHRVRYVGKADDVKRRLAVHIHEALHRQKRNHRLNWIRSVLESGHHPQLAIIESGEGPWQWVERHWIAFYRMAGHELTNGTDGGEGTVGRIASEETKARLSAGVRASRKIPGAMARLNAAAQSPEARAKRSASQKRAWQDPERKARWIAALKGHHHSAETRARLSAITRARTLRCKS
jgi:hypothetical protein